MIETLADLVERSLWQYGGSVLNIPDMPPNTTIGVSYSEFYEIIVDFTDRFRDGTLSFSEDLLKQNFLYWRGIRIIPI